ADCVPRLPGNLSAVLINLDNNTVTANPPVVLVPPRVQMTLFESITRHANLFSIKNPSATVTVPGTGPTKTVAGAGLMDLVRNMVLARKKTLEAAVATRNTLAVLNSSESDHGEDESDQPDPIPLYPILLYPEAKP